MTLCDLSDRVFQDGVESFDRIDIVSRFTQAVPCEQCAANDDQGSLLIIVECLGDFGEVLLDMCCVEWKVKHRRSLGDARGWRSR